MEAFKCDRCGKYYQHAKKGLVICTTEIVDANSGETAGYDNAQDLCPACQDQLERWFYKTTKQQQQKARQFETPELNGGFIFR